MSYTCTTCGEMHEDLPDIGADRPDYWWGVAESEREDRIQLTEDTCIIDDNHFFIRGVIEIPILGENKCFGFGVWISQKKENFYKYLENPESDEIGPFFGWLSTNIHFYSPTTISLKTMAYFRGNGLRPSIELESSEEHPLATDQRDGITLKKAWQIVHFYENMN